MLTRETTSGPRVRHSRLALFILNSALMSYLLFITLGFGRILSKYRQTFELKNVRIPHKRLKLLLAVFIDDNFIIKSPTSDFRKSDLLNKFEKINSMVLSNKSNFYTKLTERVLGQDVKFLKGRYFFTLIRNHFSNDIRREFLTTKIMSLTFDINNRCNRKCKHCFASSSNKKGNVVEYKFLKNALTEAREKLGCRFFNILGGEPFLDFEKILKVANDFKYIPIQVFTNGDLINKNVINELIKYPNIIPLISLEGNEQMTDSVRGAGTYKSVSKAFNFLKNSSILYGASITVNRKNFNYLSSSEFADILLDFGVYHTWIFDLKPIGRTESDQLCLLENEKIQFNERIELLNSRYPIFFINTEKDPELIGGCPATKGTYFHIFADGSVMPCITIRFKDEALNIENKSLTQIINSDVFHQYRNISCFRGCAQRCEPEKFANWIHNNSLIPY